MAQLKAEARSRSRIVAKEYTEYSNANTTKRPPQRRRTIFIGSSLVAA
jgi:hypothetical protein